MYLRYALASCGLGGPGSFGGNHPKPYKFVTFGGGRPSIESAADGARPYTGDPGQPGSTRVFADQPDSGIRCPGYTPVPGEATPSTGNPPKPLKFMLAVDKVGRRWGATAYPGHGSSPTCPARAPAGTGLPGPGHAMARYQRRPNQTATLPNPINLSRLVEASRRSSQPPMRHDRLPETRVNPGLRLPARSGLPLSRVYPGPGCSDPIDRQSTQTLEIYSVWCKLAVDKVGRR